MSLERAVVSPGTRSVPIFSQNLVTQLCVGKLYSKVPQAPPQQSFPSFSTLQTSELIFPPPKSCKQACPYHDAVGLANWPYVDPAVVSSSGQHPAWTFSQDYWGHIAAVGHDLFCTKQSKHLLQISYKNFHRSKRSKKNSFSRNTFQFPQDKLQQTTAQIRSHTIILLWTVLLGSSCCTKTFAARIFTTPVLTWLTKSIFPHLQQLRSF